MIKLNWNRNKSNRPEPICCRVLPQFRCECKEQSAEVSAENHFSYAAAEGLDPSGPENWQYLKTAISKWLKIQWELTALSNQCHSSVGTRKKIATNCKTKSRFFYISNVYHPWSVHV